MAPASTFTLPLGTEKGSEKGIESVLHTAHTYYYDPQCPSPSLFIPPWLQKMNEQDEKLRGTLHIEGGPRPKGYEGIVHYCPAGTSGF